MSYEKIKFSKIESYTRCKWCHENVLFHLVRVRHVALLQFYLLLMKPIGTPFSNNLFNLQISFYQRNLTHQPFGKEFDLTAIIVYYFFFSFSLLFLATYFVLLFLL